MLRSFYWWVFTWYILTVQKTEINIKVDVFDYKMINEGWMNDEWVMNEW